MRLAKTVIGVFEERDKAEKAVAEMRKSGGFHTDEISIVQKGSDNHGHGGGQRSGHGGGPNDTGDNDTDAAIDFFLKFPKFLLKTAVLLISFLDRHGIAPKALRDADGLHATVFLANLGSINLPSSPHHHLYEWGTTSIFLTMGMLRRKRVYDENGERSYIDAMDIGVTVDERITDGFYFIKSMHLFQDYLNNPERLMERPQLPDRGPTVKEMRKQKRMLKKQARKQRRQKEKATA